MTETDAASDIALPALDWLEAAAALVYGALSPTPQYRWPLLSRRVGTDTGRRAVTAT